MYRTTKAANQLFMEGQLVLADIEHNGVRVDKARLDATIEKAKVDIAELERRLTHHKVFREWQRVYKSKTNLSSRDQLAHVLFSVMGHEVTQVTLGGKTGKMRASTRKDALEMIDEPFVKEYLRLEPLKKSLATNLYGIKREMVEHDDGCWYVHPHFHLNKVITFRSSSSDPNWQNYPKRNPEIASIVRPLFIPRKGRHFVEIDYSQIEVRVAAVVTRDKALRKYIHDKSTDMHRDQAIACFKLAKDEVSKPVRQSTKSNFVFASFYGSRYWQCAKRLWDDIERFQLKTAQGTPLKKHLARKGVKELGVCDPKVDALPGTFVHHLKRVEEDLWRRFGEYSAWKKATFNQYRRDGGLLTHTGFAVNGLLSFNDVTNYPIQGPAFHCDLWSLIQIWMWLRKYRMKTCLLGEIHDSNQKDAVPSELDDVLSVSKRIMTEDLPRAWPWIDVPLEVEVEVSPKNGSWYECKEWVETDGRWGLKA